MRCPRCSSNRTHAGFCLVCGAGLSEAPLNILPIEGLMPDDNLTIPDPIPPEGYIECPRCQFVCGPSPVCERCGEIVKRLSAFEIQALTTGIRCLKCGFENARRDPLCRNCGMRL